MTPVATETTPLFVELAGTRQFTTDEYHRMIDAGILGPDDKVELLEGYILFKADYPELAQAGGAFPEWRWLRRFTSAEYHRLFDLGIIGADEKVELLDGFVVLKMPQNVPHRAATARLATRLAPRLPFGWVVFTQCPISIGGMDPEPDGVVLRGVDADYDTRVPVESDFGIVIGVSDSSLEFDRRGKARLYARTGIPVYWIVNIPDRQVEVYADPDPAANPPAYRTRTDFGTADAVPVVLDGVAVATLPVADLIP